MAVFQVATKLAQDSRNRVIGMHKGALLALKAKVLTKVVDQEDEVESKEEVAPLKPKEYETVHKYYMALATRKFLEESIQGQGLCGAKHQVKWIEGWSSKREVLLELSRQIPLHCRVSV